jgi:hypothetical protein
LEFSFLKAKIPSISAKRTSLYKGRKAVSKETAGGINEGAKHRSTPCVKEANQPNLFGIRHVSREKLDNSN